MIGRATPLSLGAASGFNVFVFSNFTEYNTDAQGRMAVGGNFAPANGGSFTIAGSRAGDTGYDLVVGGNFTNVYNSMGGGNVYVGGNMNWFAPTLPANAYVVGSFTNGGWGSVGGTIYANGGYSSVGNLAHGTFDPAQHPAPIDFASAKSSLDSLSSTLAADTANGKVVKDYSNYILTGTDATLNVFDLTAANYSGGSITINAPASSTVVVNVSGSAVSFENGQISLNGVSKSNVIFNFNSATSLTMSGYGFYGSVLAPNADFTGSWGNLDGELIANSAAGTTQFNDYAFSGNLNPGNGTGNNQPTATPEPATWLCLFTGAAFLLAVQRGRAFHRRQKTALL